MVEGVFDAMKCPENAIPMLGSTLASNSLLFKRLVANQSCVYLSLDPDMKEKSYSLAKKLVQSGCSVYMSFAAKDRDIGSMNKADAKKLLESSTPYTGKESLNYAISKIKSGSMI